MTAVNGSWSVRLALKSYDWLWRAATPLLSRSHRLKEGLSQRLGQPFPQGPFDIWIQAASAGESFLVELILERLGSSCPHRILVTTNTRQGKDILDTHIGRPHDPPPTGKRRSSAYFPFDRPSLMKAAVAAIRPRLVVLLETEIWPGLMNALKTAGIPFIIVNGRMRAKSLRHYRLWPQLWRALTPDRILAVSTGDAERYAHLYGQERVSVMPNMKFDRIRADLAHAKSNPVSQLIPPGVPLVVLGSVRREEEDAVGKMIAYLLDQHPDILIGLFPRHMHRIPSWQARLAATSIPCQLRSEPASAAAGGVLLWDVFGELANAYAAATAAFVGGTLAPLGGQNFLEPLTCGLIPAIGPSWKTFDWVGEDLFAKGLVRVADDWRAAADTLLELLAAPPSRQAVKKALGEYLIQRQGGTAMAVAAIETFLARRRSVTPSTERH
jgi:3-deoxy-D-manno-octulosonic-acid transferase